MPECYLDTNLVEFLLGRSNSVNHKKGNSSVVAQMKDKRFASSFAVAIIDDDKRRIKELDECMAIERLWKTGLRIFKHPKRQHYFIQLSPAIEVRVIKECEKGDISLANYNLPVHFKDLKNMKGFTQRNDQRFKSLFREMVENKKCDEIVELKRWLLFLKENN